MSTTLIAVKLSIDRMTGQAMSATSRTPPGPSRAWAITLDLPGRVGSTTAGRSIGRETEDIGTSTKTTLSSRTAGTLRPPLRRVRRLRQAVRKWPKNDEAAGGDPRLPGITADVVSSPWASALALRSQDWADEANLAGGARHLHSVKLCWRRGRCEKLRVDARSTGTLQAPEPASS